MHSTAATYSCLLSMARCLGIKVYHRKLKNDYGRQYRNKLIIDSRLKNRIFGLSILVHEILHNIHELEGRYPEFYSKVGKFSYSRRNMDLVSRAETAASRDGKKLLEAMGFKDVYFRELDPTKKELMESIWRQEYFED